ncbi:hypothetical protein [Pantoea ananatis]|jgi:hypothetical protein|uniref:Uncharacterized protein n=1 Tax=Pantoea ananas TaxID=553 RepID=A0AAJ1D192_PANAN|nr:hypothetical protein [Pantoea ananatis]MCW0307106.1 hypothetical protein [Pantoea ananatis]MCW0339105.1 hypothetical protein [Pantoea ananatis]MCW0345400.1 hypothetical protein [Pantoea ananatis]MCW0348325.1 hypothetical protein [Pantoea ananatis]MCW0355599.1 hypothetical protein [Pantoea ananatis]
MTNPADTRTSDNFTQSSLRERLFRYEFVECHVLICFLDMCCCERLGQSELFYIRSKIRECLWSHDEGSAWFDDLRLMESEVSRLLAIQHKKHQAGGLQDSVSFGCSCPWRNCSA